MSLVTKDRDIKRNKRIALLLFTALIVLASLIIIEEGLQFSISKQIVMERVYQETTNIAKYSAFSISGDDTLLLNPGDENTELFQEMTEQLWQIQNQHPHVTFVYVFRLVDGKVTFVLDSEYGRNDFDEPLIGYIYDYPEREILDAFRGKSTYTKDFFTDEWGTYISSFVPLFSSTGEIVGIVGVDMSHDIIDPYIRELETNFIATVTFASVLVLIAMGAGVYVIFISNKQYSKINNLYISLLDAAEAANEGIFEFNWSDNTFRFSPFISNTLDKDRKESQIHIHDLCQMAVAEDQPLILAAIDKKKYDPKNNQFHNIWRFYTADKTVDLYLKGTVLCDPDTNEPVRIVGTGEDYTEFMRDKAALTQTTNSLRIFASILHNAIEDVTRQQMTIVNRISADEGLSSNMKFFVSKIFTSLNSVIALCAFARSYADIGYDEPKWVSLQNAINGFSNHPAYSMVDVECKIEDVEIYADMMFANVLYNLFDNSIRHGKKVTSIKIKTALDNDDLIISYEDDGVGLTEKEKETLFVRGAGRNTGLGMFLSRKILSMTDIKIEEVGKPGSGAVFLIIVRPGYYRMMN